MPVSKRQFFSAFLVLVLCFAAANSIVSFLTRHSLPRRFLAAIASSPGASFAAVGNSLTLIGFDPVEFDTAMGLHEPQTKSLNLAMSSTNPVEHLLYFRYALAHRVHPRFWIYGFLDLQLSQPVELSNADIIGNHDVLYYLEPEYARRFFSLSPRDSVKFEVMRRFGMLADRSAVWAKIELVRRSLAAQGMPPIEENRFGRAADFSLLESGDPLSFASEADAASGSPLIPPVEEMLRLASQSGCRIVFVEMPMPSLHRRLFYDTSSWIRYRAHIRSLIEEQGGLYIDASHWIDDDSLFLDHIHLNAKGGVVFTQKLAALFQNNSQSGAEKTSLPPGSSGLTALPNGVPRNK